MVALNWLSDELRAQDSRQRNFVKTGR
jgi:hypothetical protein